MVAGAPYEAPSFVPAPRFHATTSNALDGYDVVEVLGLVRGITVRSRSLAGRLGAALQQIRGGEISLLTELCEQTRARAFEIAVEHTRTLGGNALIAVRYDATEIMAGVSEVLCYGTAVRAVARGDLARGDLERDRALEVTREVTRAEERTATV